MQILHLGVLYEVKLYLDNYDTAYIYIQVYIVSLYNCKQTGCECIFKNECCVSFDRVSFDRREIHRGGLKKGILKSPSVPRDI